MLLAADIGGTKTLLQLSDETGRVVRQRRYDSARYADFDALLEDFTAGAGLSEPVDSACFAVAGPINGRRASVTNLPWQLDADQLAARFSIRRLQLCNDFAAVGHGISTLEKDDVLTLQTGVEVDGPRAVLGAGTGLGQAVLVRQDTKWHVLATEGGHVDFAPGDRTQMLLLEHLFARFGHVSWERILSGTGLVTLYHFLRDYRQHDEHPDLRLAMVQGDAAAAISEFAARQRDALAVEALALFFSIYGAQAGNLALNVLPTAGLYIAGGIAQNNVFMFEQPGFLDAFLNKGRMRGLLERIPVHLVLQAEVGLNGARLLARQALYN